MVYFVKGLQRKESSLNKGEVVRELHRSQGRSYGVICSRVIIPNMVSRRCSKKMTQVSNKECTLLEGSRERSRATIKGRLLESTIGLKED